MPPIPQPKTALPRLEEPGWLPLWISATPFRHPIFLGVLAIPLLADALHSIKDWSLLIGPIFAYCAWRKLLYVLHRRLGLGSRTVWLLPSLFLALLLTQLLWWQFGEGSTEEHWFTSTLPSFLAGPLIGIGMGLLHVGSVRQRSVIVFFALLISLSWALIPISLEVAVLTPQHWNGQDNWFTAIPLLGSAANGLILGLSMMDLLHLRQLSPFFTLPFLLGFTIIEIRLRGLPWRSSLLTLAGILVFLPFFNEWEYSWWD